MNRQEYLAKPTAIDFQVAGVELTEGDERLVRLVAQGLGIRHPAMKDLMALLLRAKAQKGPSAREVLQNLYAVCEVTEEECSKEGENDFQRGRAFEAKHIRRGLGTWFQDETRSGSEA